MTLAPFKKNNQNKLFLSRYLQPEALSLSYSYLDGPNVPNSFILFSVHSTYAYARTYVRIQQNDLNPLNSAASLLGSQSRQQYYATEQEHSMERRERTIQAKQGRALLPEKARKKVEDFVKAKQIQLDSQIDTFGCQNQCLFDEAIQQIDDLLVCRQLDRQSAIE